MAENIPSMKLWYYPKYRSTRCVWLIKELDIEKHVEYKFIDVHSASKKELPEYLHYKKSIHPHGWVPALEIEGRPPMFESGAICMYLADLCGRLLPEPKDRSEYYNWVFYCTCTVDTALAALTMQWMFLPEDQWDHKVIDGAKVKADLCLDTLDNVLQNRRYILGDEFSAADCVVGYSVVWAAALNEGVLLKDRPSLQAYRSTVSARPALQQALALSKP